MVVMARAAVALWFLAVPVVINGCGAPESGDRKALGGEFTLVESTAYPDVVTFVVVVDDTQTGLVLADQVASMFDSFEEQIEDRSWPTDPGTWYAVDYSAVIVHPSSPAERRYSSPASDTALRWQARNRSIAGAAPWEAAVRKGIESAPAPPGAPFQALAAFSETSLLFSGRRAPATSAEQMMFASLPNEGAVGFFFAAETEDESPGAPEGYVVPDPDPLGSWNWTRTIVPRASTPAMMPPVLSPQPPACDYTYSGPATPRFEQWATMQKVAAPSALIQYWPCNSAVQIYGGFDRGSFLPCLAHPLMIESDGRAHCTVTGSFAGTDRCPEEAAWLDPVGADGMRAPQVAQDKNGATTRVCEVRQLEGDALASCRSSLDCTDCEPGWCATAVPELLQYCPFSYPSPFRFVLGASQPRPGVLSVGSLSIACETPDPP
jgi:hypothetical protein